MVCVVKGLIYSIIIDATCKSFSIRYNYINMNDLINIEYIKYKEYYERKEKQKRI